MSETDGAPSPLPAPTPDEAEVNPMISEIARLPADSEVRRLAVRLIRGAPVESIQPLVTALLRTDLRHWREARLAVWVLGHLELDAQQQDAAANILLEVLEKTRREPVWLSLRRVFRRASLYVVLPMALFALLTHLPVRDYGVLFRIICVFEMFGLIITAPFSALSDRLDRNRIRVAAARALGRWRVPEAVGSLAGALNDRSQEVQNAASEALAETLPTLTDAHRGIMGAESMSNLGRGLRHPDAQIVYLILGALAKIGTSHAIPYVERARRSGRTTRIRDAAEEVLQVLTKRQHEERLTNQLLRPTSAIDSTADHLLRPAGGARESEPDRLLRAILQDHREN